MKKSILFIGLALALAGCGSDTYEEWADSQHSDPEQIKNVKLEVKNAEAIDFGTLVSDSVQIFVPTITTENTSTVENSFTVELFNADNTASQTLNASAEGKVNSLEFKQTIDALYGKKPSERQVSMFIQGYSTTPEGVTIKNNGTATATVTIVAPFIDEAYWLVGDFAGWNKDSALKFDHVGDGNVYDNPEFQIVFKTTDANQYWKIIPQTNYDGDFWANGETGVVGVVNDGDSSFEGNLTTNNPGAGKLEEASIYRLTINMMEYTYKLEKLNFQEYFYEIGNESGWATPHALYGPNFDGKYQGYYWLDGEFKFKPNKEDWLNDYEYDGEGKLADIPGGPNCPDPGAGFYQIDVDLAASTYSITKVKSITCVGNHNGWNQADAAQHMTYNSAEGCWELTTTLTNGFKFAMNDEWTVSWGGANGDPSSYGNLTQNGGKDLNAPEGDGVYEIKLYLSYEGNNKVVFTKK